jgi:hypothetical protein
MYRFLSGFAVATDAVDATCSGGDGRVDWVYGLRWMESMNDTSIDTPIETGAAPVFDLRSAARIYHAGAALKALKYGEIGGYLVVWGDTNHRDSYGEYFTAQTDFGLDRYQNQPVLYHHGMDDSLVTPIGTIVSIAPDEIGLYARAILDVNHEDPTIRQYARDAYTRVNNGQLFWSSGSAGHLVRTTEDGEIVQWWIVEGSTTPDPAEQSGRTQVEILRAATKALLQTELEPLEPPAKEAVTPVEPLQKRLFIRRKGTNMSMKMDMASVMSVLDGSTLSPEQKWELATALAQAEAGEEGMEGEAPAMNADTPVETPPEPEAPIAARSDTVVDAQSIARAMLEQMRSAPAKGLPGGGGQNPAAKPPANAITLRTKYHDLSPIDMSYMLEWRSGMARHNKGVTLPNVKFYRELVDKTQKALQYETTRSVMQLPHDTANRILAIKDNELDNSLTAGAILEWIPDIWASELWRRVRVENEAASQFRVVEMPTDPYNLPIESTDPTVYLVPQTTNEAQLILSSSANPTPDSKVSSGKVILNAGKLGLRVGFSSEAEEDSIIPFIPQLREQGVRTLANAVDNVLINGDTDTTASTNINDIDGTPAATDKYLIFDGILKNALVTNLTNTITLSNGYPTLRNIRALRAKLQSTLNVYGTRPDDLVMFVDISTWFTMLSIDEINAWLNNGRNATVNNGMLPNIDGIPIFPSAEMGLANTAGKISETAGNNLYGRIAMAAKSGWTIGYRRQVMTNVDYLSYYDSYQFTANLRIAFINKDTAASAAAVYINVG